MPHGDHVDYLVNGHLHHPHGTHCDDHGPLELRPRPHGLTSAGVSCVATRVRPRPTAACAATLASPIAAGASMISDHWTNSFDEWVVAADARISLDDRAREPVALPPSLIENSGMASDAGAPAVR